MLVLVESLFCISKWGFAGTGFQEARDEDEEEYVDWEHEDQTGGVWYSRAFGSLGGVVRVSQIQVLIVDSSVGLHYLDVLVRPLPTNVVSESFALYELASKCVMLPSWVGRWIAIVDYRKFLILLFHTFLYIYMYWIVFLPIGLDWKNPRLIDDNLPINQIKFLNLISLLFILV